MKSPIFLTALLVSSFPLMGADTLEESYRLEDHGRLRNFVVARDEIVRNQTTVRIAPRATANEVRAAARTSGGDLVLYERGRARSPYTRRFLTHRLAVQVAPGYDPAALAVEAGAENVQPTNAPGWHIFQSGADPGSALQVTTRLRRLSGVLSAGPLLARQQVRRFVPSDPFFNQQWHLLNTGQLGGLSGIDVNITGAWDSYQGTGITIGILDDGLEHTHPDLAANYDAADSIDLNFDSPDPQPAPYDGDDHGTACAGLAAAVGNNGMGVAGAAFKAKVAGIRLIALPDTDEQEATAFSLHNDVIQVKSNSWGPTDDGKTLDGPGPLATAAIEDALQNGRNGNGTIFVWAGGNGALLGDASTFDGYTSNRGVIAVGAITSNGVKATYSESGTNLICCAPSSGSRKELSIATVDRAGDDGYNFFQGLPGELSDTYYTKLFGGTSACAPVVAGCVALMLQASPSLGWRDVQEIILTTARQIDLGSDNGASEGWITNGGGFHFNDKYGAGLIDTTAAVNLAANWGNLPPEISLSQEMDNLAHPIPNNKADGVSFSFNFSDANFRVEHARVTVDIQHAARGQLQITLQSPSNTVSKLAPLRPKDKNANFDHWPFESVHHWGESASGTWTVNIADRVGGAAGLVNSVKVTLFGASAHVHVDNAGTSLISDPNNNGGVDPGEQVTLNFQLKNDGQETATNVTATLQGDTDVTNPAGAGAYGSLDPGQSAGAPFSFTVNAADHPGQIIHPTLNVSYFVNGVQKQSSVVFPVVLGKIETATFSNTTATDTQPVAIPSFASRSGSGNAAPYPSTVTVSGLPATAVITNVVLHLNHFEDSRTNTMAALLVSPGGKSMIPMSDAGVGDAEEISLTFSDSATTALSNAVGLTSGTFLPTNHAGTTHPFPAPPHGVAPPKPSGTGFSVFNGENPGGDWQLYIRNNKGGGFGGLGDWSLDITYAH